jgi:hypothetical protein
MTSNINLTTFSFQELIQLSSIVFNTHWKNITQLIPDKYFDYVVDDVPYGLNVGAMAFLTEKKTLDIEKIKKTSKNIFKGKKNNRRN